MNNTLPFLDVLLIRDRENLKNTAYRKDTQNLHLHWNSFNPWWIINQVSTSIQENINKDESSAYFPGTSIKTVAKLLQYAGPKGSTIIKTMNNS